MAACKGRFPKSNRAAQPRAMDMPTAPEARSCATERKPKSGSASPWRRGGGSASSSTPAGSCWAGRGRMGVATQATQGGLWRACSCNSGGPGRGGAVGVGCERDARGRRASHRVCVSYCLKNGLVSNCPAVQLVSVWRWIELGKQGHGTTSAEGCQWQGPLGSAREMGDLGRRARGWAGARAARPGETLLCGTYATEVAGAHRVQARLGSIGWRGLAGSGQAQWAGGLAAGRPAGAATPGGAPRRPPSVGRPSLSNVRASTWLRNAQPLPGPYNS